jgi:hypothetical protein
VENAIVEHNSTGKIPCGTFNWLLIKIRDIRKEFPVKISYLIGEFVFHRILFGIFELLFM